MKPLAGPGATPIRRVSSASLSACIPSQTVSLRVAGAVGVVQQQQVELVDAAALEAALGRHPQVARVLLRAAQARVGEAREALGAVALALVEVVTDGADDADLLAGEPLSGSVCANALPSARPSNVSASPAPYASAVRTVGISASGVISAWKRSSSSGSPKCMKRPPLQVPIAVRVGSSPGLSALIAS